MHATDSPTISHLLAKWHDGDHEPLRALVPLLYEDLRYEAHQSLRKARPGPTLQTAALVHESTGVLRSSTPLNFKTVSISSQSAPCLCSKSSWATGAPAARPSVEEAASPSPSTISDLRPKVVQSILSLWTKLSMGWRNSTLRRARSSSCASLADYRLKRPPKCSSSHPPPSSVTGRPPGSSFTAR